MPEKEDRYHTLKVFKKNEQLLLEDPIKREKSQQKTKTNSEFEG
jgi:hypothetical protein